MPGHADYDGPSLDGVPLLLLRLYVFGPPVVDTPPEDEKLTLAGTCAEGMYYLTLGRNRSVLRDCREMPCGPCYCVGAG